MEDFGDADFALNHEVEHSIVAHPKTVKRGIVMRPHEPNVSPDLD